MKKLLVLLLAMGGLLHGMQRHHRSEKKDKKQLCIVNIADKHISVRIGHWHRTLCPNGSRVIDHPGQMPIVFQDSGEPKQTEPAVCVVKTKTIMVKVNYHPDAQKYTCATQDALEEEAC